MRAPVAAGRAPHGGRHTAGNHDLPTFGVIRLTREAKTTGHRITETGSQAIPEIGALVT
ncbi:hypothetical protein ACIBCT_40215 [Streptosporangium sp. NPDC050855]|uniref:hypothetical protein n=1 Tax=Streptosporangium sp. NPDC050855 TaxID=3366194 RepID=UPI0037B59464